MRIQLDSHTLNPDHPLLLTVIGKGAEQASIRVVGHRGFVGHEPQIQISVEGKRPRWRLDVKRLPVELYKARQRVLFEVEIHPRRGTGVVIRKELPLQMAPSDGSERPDSAPADPWPTTRIALRPRPRRDEDSDEQEDGRGDEASDQVSSPPADTSSEPEPEPRLDT